MSVEDVKFQAKEEHGHEAREVVSRTGYQILLKMMIWTSYSVSWKSSN